MLQEGFLRKIRFPVETGMEVQPQRTCEMILQPTVGKIMVPVRVTEVVHLRTVEDVGQTGVEERRHVE